MNARRPNLLKAARVLEVLTIAEAADIDPASCLPPAAIISRVVKKVAPLPINAIKEIANIFSLPIAPGGDDSPAVAGGVLPLVMLLLL
jgi:hypothetical protein